MTMDTKDVHFHQQALTSLCVDPTVLPKMVGDNVEIHKKLFDKFIQDTPLSIEQIQRAYAEKDAIVIGEVGHKLKSSSRALGANPFADLCFSLQIAGKEEDWQLIDELYPQITVLFEDVKNYVSEAFKFIK